MIPSVYEIFLLGICVYREASGEPSEGMSAVAHTVMNRVRAGWYGGTIFGNLTAKNQFSSMSVIGDPTMKKWPPPDAVALSIASTAALGLSDDPSGGALFYENPAIATSEWFIREVREKRRVSARIGKHVFYA